MQEVKGFDFFQNELFSLLVFLFFVNNMNWFVNIYKRLFGSEFGHASHGKRTEKTVSKDNI